MAENKNVCLGGERQSCVYLKGSRPKPGTSTMSHKICSALPRRLAYPHTMKMYKYIRDLVCIFMYTGYSLDIKRYLSMLMHTVVKRPDVVQTLPSSAINLHPTSPQGHTRTKTDNIMICIIPSPRSAMERLRINQSLGFSRSDRTLTKATMVPVFPSIFTTITITIQDRSMATVTGNPDSLIGTS